jgi:hypothetical protein
MTIYPDASFLVSWLYKPDPLNAKARTWFSRHQADENRTQNGILPKSLK